MHPAPCSWAHSCLRQALPVGRLPPEVSPRAVAQRVQSSVFPFRCVFSLLLGLHLEQRTLFGFWRGARARPCAAHNRWYVDKAHPRVGEPRQGAGNRDRLLDPCFWESLAPARASFQQLCVGWKGSFLHAVPFPGMRGRNEEWGASASKGTPLPRPRSWGKRGPRKKAPEPFHLRVNRAIFMFDLVPSALYATTR